MTALVTSFLTLGFSPACAERIYSRSEIGQLRKDRAIASEGDRFGELSTQRLTTSRCGAATERGWDIVTGTETADEMRLQAFPPSDDPNHQGVQIRTTIGLDKSGHKSLQTTFLPPDSSKAEQILIFRKKRTTTQGVVVDEFTYAGTDHPELAALHFRRPVNRAEAISFEPWAYCAFAGFEPEQLRILFKPGRREELLSWARAQQAHRHLVIMNGEPLSALQHQSFGPIDEQIVANGAEVRMEVGAEAEIAKSLKKQDWIIDFAMYPYPLSPPGSLFVLPDGMINFGNSTTLDAMRFVDRVLRLAFPNVPAARFLRETVGKAGFEIILSAPMREIAPSRLAYGPYWLKTTVRIAISGEAIRVGRPQHFAMLTISDGYLPKWPGTQEPPVGHYRQAQLDPESSDPFKGDGALDIVDTQIKDVLISRLNAMMLGS